MRFPPGQERKLDPDDMERLGVPPEFWRVTLSGVPDSVHEIVERYIKEFDARFDQSAGLLLLGEEGVGKTSISTLVLKRARMRGYSAMFLALSDLRESIKARLNFSEEKSLLARVKEVEVLAIDHVAASDAGDKFWGEPQLADLVVYRGQRRRLTIITSRLEGAEFGNCFPRLATESRGYLVGVNVTGPNQRLARANALKAAVLGK